METNVIFHGDCVEEMKNLPEKSINMCMTSPPYWALRDYGVEGQLGLEPTFEEYINKLCDIFEEVKRVLRDDGTCWVNIGDTYGGSGAGTWQNKPQDAKSKEVYALPYGKSSVSKMRGTPMDKCLLMIPMRFAIEMVNRGWILRNTIIWHKPNCMPSSVRDRFTVDFEYIFFFSKNKRYFFKQQLEKTLTKDNIVRDRDTTKLNNTPGRSRMGGLKTNDYDMKNKRTTWTIPPKPFSEAHFAVYPEELCETPIDSSCPEFMCIKCEKPREKIIKSEQVKTESDYRRDGRGIMGRSENQHGGLSGYKKTLFKQVGYTDCGCNSGFIGGIVLDPFFGAGTTGLVALKQRKRFIGIELNSEYIEIANKRLKPYLEQTTL